MPMPSARVRSKKSDHDRYVFCKATKDTACSACKVKVVSGSLFYHILMTMVKAVVGVVTGSKVLVAEAVHSFSDCLAFGINYLGANSRDISVLLQSILIGSIMFLSGIWICADNAALIITRVPAHPGLFALLVAKISILANLHLYMVSLCAYRRDPGNGNVFMFMVQNRTNLYAAVCGFTGILLADLGLVYFDPIGAIVIGLFQVQGAVQIFKECFEKESVTVTELKKKVVICLGVAMLGIMLFFFSGVTTVLSHRNVVLIPSEGGTFDSPVSTLLGRAPYFCIVDLKDRTTTMQPNKSWQYNVDESRVLGAVAQNSNVGVVLAGKVGPKMFSVLTDSGVRVYYFEGPGSVRTVFADYQASRLKPAAAANSSTGFGRTQVRWMGAW